MKLDSAFQIGKTHDICEDFALTGVFKGSSNDACYTVVSDGCSSSPNTDLGSRLLSFSIVNELKQIHDNSAFFKQLSSDACISRARSTINSLNIPEECLDTTALIAYHDSHETEISIQGDGCVALGLDDGRILVVNVEFIKGFPFYVNYLPTYNQRYKAWHKQNPSHEFSLNVSSSLIDVDGKWEVLSEKIIVHHFKYDKDGSKVSIIVNDHGATISFGNKPKNMVKFIVLMSDGIHSFYQATDTGTSLTNVDVDYREIITEVLKFKNFNGKFMQRRLNRFLKFCAKNNWNHADDISFGVIYFGDK